MQDRYLDLEEPSFNSAEMCDLAGVNMDTLNNWVRYEHLHFVAQNPESRRPRRMFTLLEAFKGRVIAHLIEKTAMLVGDASCIARFAAPIVANNILDLSAGTNVYLVCSGPNWTPSTYWTKPGDRQFYGMNPMRHPNALPEAFPPEAFVMLPAALLFRQVCADAEEILEGEE